MKILIIGEAPDALRSVLARSRIGEHTLTVIGAGDGPRHLQAGRHDLCILTLPELNAHAVGQLLYLLEYQTALAGRLLGLNAFDQPAVEFGKKVARALLGGRAEPEERRWLETAHRNALRLLKLVNSLLDFSRIEAGRAQASFAPTELSSLTSDLASVFRSAIENAGLRYRIDCPVPAETSSWGSMKALYR